MTEFNAMSQRVDRYVRGQLGERETADFEAELLESPSLQDAVEAALGLQRAFRYEAAMSESRVVHLTTPGTVREEPESSRRHWGLAASLAAAAVTAGLLWRSEAENAYLQSRIAELDRPVDAVVSVPLDVMRSSGLRTPDARVRKPAGAALLILDVEVAAQLARLESLDLELLGEQGARLLRWSTAPNAAGRIQVALRTDRLPTGLLELRMSNTASAVVDRRFVELLPAAESPAVN